MTENESVLQSFSCRSGRQVLLKVKQNPLRSHLSYKPDFDVSIEDTLFFSVKISSRH
jgi:hypothetical protein